MRTKSEREHVGRRWLRDIDNTGGELGALDVARLELEVEGADHRDDGCDCLVGSEVLAEAESRPAGVSRVENTPTHPPLNA